MIRNGRRSCEGRQRSPVLVCCCDGRCDHCAGVLGDGDIVTEQDWDAKAILLKLRKPSIVIMVRGLTRFADNQMGAPSHSHQACFAVGVGPTDDNKRELVAAISRVLP